MNTIIIFLLAMVGWSAWGLFSSRVEQAEYEVLKKNKKYEIRKYPKHIVAQTVIKGDYMSAMSSGFRVVANYIFGGNAKKQSISMTAPVGISSDSTKEESIISFGMPKKYTLESLPVSNDGRVKIVEVPEKTFAVIRFGGYRSAGKLESMATKLKELLNKDGIRFYDSFSYAGYNAPWTPPWMMRNEVLIEIINS
jgi:effector-binding domain-containing protein